MRLILDRSSERTLVAFGDETLTLDSRDDAWVARLRDFLPTNSMNFLRPRRLPWPPVSRKSRWLAMRAAERCGPCVTP